MKQQIHLRGKGYSGRAVRIKTLDASTIDANFMAAGKLAGDEASGVEIKTIEWRNAVKQFITEFSEPCESAVAETTKWRKPKPGEFDERMDEIFTVKDIQTLIYQYKMYHEVTLAEVEAIVGEAITLSED